MMMQKFPQQLRFMRTGLGRLNIKTVPAARWLSGVVCRPCSSLRRQDPTTFLKDMTFISVQGLRLGDGKRAPNMCFHLSIEDLVVLESFEEDTFIFMTDKDRVDATFQGLSILFYF